MSDILTTRLNIEKNIDKCTQKLYDLQDECPHTNVDKKYKANTGNYDPSADSYWIELSCPDCGKWWMEDQ
jgi:hypothetical protein